MTHAPVTVAPETTVEELVERFMYPHHHKLFPVTTGGRLLGCVSTEQVKAVPRSQWAGRTVGELTVPCSPQNTVAPSADAFAVLTAMSRTGRSRLLVADDGGLVGIVTLRDLLDLFALKVELEP
jgi:CBS-domain-containing membrane protein